MILRICLWLILVTSVRSTVYSADLLQWRLSTGDSLRYVIQNEMLTTADVGGFESKSRLIQTMQLAWNVRTLTASRSYVVSQVIDRIRVEMSPSEEKSVVFDSGSRDVPDDLIARSIGNVFRKLVGREFTVTMAPTGVIQDVVIPEDLLKTLKTAAFGTPNGLDDKSLEKMLSQTSVILPANSVDIGDRWQSQQSVELPFATLHMDANMTYRGVDNDGLAVIDYAPTVTLKQKKNAPIQLILRDSLGSGKVLFDKDQGHVVRMQLKLEMDMETTVQGQQVLQTIRQQTIMSLQK